MFKNRFLNNTSWLVGGKIVQMLISLVISAIMARYLGPDNYGIINYTNAYISFFSSICTLGLDAIIVKEMIANREQEGELIGTVIVLRLVASFVSMILIYGLMLSASKGDQTIVIVGMLQSISLVFASFNIIYFWYQSYLQSKIATIIQTIAYIAMSVYRVVILIMQKDVIWFAFAVSLDTIVLGLLLLYSYKLNKKFGQNLMFNKKWIKPLLKQSYPFILSGIMSTVYGQMDKIMIGEMMNQESVGLYSTAIVVTGLWSFIPVAFLDSARPLIMEAKGVDEEKYKRRLKQLYSFIIWLSFAYAIFMTIFGKYVILILYGEQYLGAQIALNICVWYCAFSYLGSAKNIWIICEGKMRYETLFTFIGATTNIILNYILIPKYGIVGASVATLITQIVTNYIIMFLFKDTRENAMLVTEAIFLRNVISKETINNAIKKIRG